MDQDLLLKYYCQWRRGNSKWGILTVRLRDELYRNGCGYAWLERNWKDVRVACQQLQQDGKESKVWRK